MASAPKTLEMPTVDTALPGRAQAIPTARTHFVNGHELKGPYPDGTETAVLAMGCSGAWSGCSGRSPASM
jgi:peptide-methionine (S)-S-oxide reductase